MSAEPASVGTTGVRFVHEVEPAPKPRRPVPVREETPMVQCPDCPEKFTTAQALGPHRNKAHGFRRDKGPGGGAVKATRPKQRCSYCKREGHKLRDCPQYQAYCAKKRKAKGKRQKVARPPRRRGAGNPQGFESTLARLRAKRDEIDAAVRTLEAVEGLLT